MIIIRSFAMIACALTMSLMAIAAATLPTRGVTIDKTSMTEVLQQIVQTLRSHEQMGQFRPGSVSFSLPEKNLMIRSYLQLPPKLCGDDIRNKYRMRGCLRLDLDKLWSP